MREKLGLIAGSGKFPLLVAEEARRRDVEIVALAMEGITDKRLSEFAGSVQTFKLGQIDAPIKIFKSAGVTRAVMAGKVQHVSLFGGVRPDLRAVKLMARIPDKRTDTILKAVAAEFAKDGIELIHSGTYLSHLMAVEGVMSRRKPSADQSIDIELGWKAAKALAGFDIGQTVVLQGGAVIAVEAMEGTDLCIQRAGELARSSGETPSLIVVKVAKPNQDLRFDIPVIGLDSLKVFSECSVKVLALEAQATLIFDKEKFLREADALGMAVTGRNP